MNVASKTSLFKAGIQKGMVGGIISERFKYEYVYRFKYENRYKIDKGRPRASKGICEKTRVKDVYGIHAPDKERVGV